MTWWMWLLASVTVYGFGWYRVAIAEARRLNDKEAAAHAERHRRHPSLKLDLSVDRRFNMTEAMMLALVWPLVLPLRALASHLDEQVGPTRTELAAENERLHADIARLEREAGLS